jgi:hypothetical protein
MQNLMTYLNDHLAGSIAAIEMLGHLAQGSQDSGMKAFFTGLRGEIEEDQNVLRDFVKTLGGEENTMKKAGAWLMEKLTRLKLKPEADDNGFGVFEALEGLALGIQGKLALWRSLSAASVPGGHHLDYARLEKRAVEQFEQVRVKCLELAPAALRGG